MSDAENVDNSQDSQEVERIESDYDPSDINPVEDTLAPLMIGTSAVIGTVWFIFSLFVSTTA